MEREKRTFSAAVAATSAWLAETGGDDPYLSHPARYEEAARLNVLADAFASEETFRLQPQALGEFGPTLVPSVGDALRRRLKNTDAYQQYTVLFGILRTLAVGYVAILSVEREAGASFRDTPIELIWPFVIIRFRGDVPSYLGLAESLTEAIHGMATMTLVDALREGGVLGRRRKRIPLVASYYAYAGSLMRAAQTTLVPEDQVHAAATGPFRDRWPLRDYVR